MSPLDTGNSSSKAIIFLETWVGRPCPKLVLEDEQLIQQTARSIMLNMSFRSRVGAWLQGCRNVLRTADEG